MDFFSSSMDQMNQELGKTIDLPTATQEFKNLMDRGNYTGIEQKPESENEQADEEQKRAQLEGFMLVY